MLKGSNRRLVVAVVVSSVFVVLPGILLASHSWGGYHWARTANPFTLKLGDNVSSDWDSYLQTTSEDWSVSDVLGTVVVAGQSNPKSCKGTSGRVEVCSSRYGNNGWLGLAQIWVSGKHITQGIVKVNDFYFSTATYNKPAWRNLVMCQEVGHTLGLDHQDENFNNTPLGTCMDYSNDPEPNQHPNSHDYDQLRDIYSHLDGTTTLDTSAATAKMPPAMGLIDFDSPGQWGRLVKGSREKGTSVYELDFGGGHRIITFVTWVRERGRD
jgi:hypothetical protein